jgi:Protein of unknown function (DUF1207)
MLSPHCTSILRAQAVSSLFKLKLKIRLLRGRSLFPTCNLIGRDACLVLIAFFTLASSVLADVRSPVWSAQRQAGDGVVNGEPVRQDVELNPRGSFASPSELQPYTNSEEVVFDDDSMETWTDRPVSAYGFGGFGSTLTAPSTEAWDWQLLPTGIVYKGYLASQKESRFASTFNNIPERDDTFWEPTLGARVGLLRFGDRNTVLPQGFQIDAEGSAQARLNLTDNVDVTSVDFRGGLPITYGYGAWRFKAGYYHLSSHLGDEFLLKNPNYPRLNFARDTLLFGTAYYLTDDLRIYGEVGWAFFTDVSEPFEVQFGIDYAPAAPTGARGAPFFALNGHLREELDYSGNFTVQAGWAWRSAHNGSLLRIGGHYFNGASWQYSFFNHFEQQLGVGLWYDF